MHPYPQYRDLTEISGVDSPNTYWRRDANGNLTMDFLRNGVPLVPFNQNMVQTEFAFASVGCYQSTTLLRQEGFECIASLNNWWPSHRGDVRRMDLYWKKLDRPNLVEEPKRLSWLSDASSWNNERSQWAYYRLVNRIAQSGCALGLDSVTGPLRTLPFNGQYWKMFFLLRLPPKPARSRLRWLKKLHFWKIAEGQLSSYWTNGMKLDEWSIEKEKARWGGWAGHYRDLGIEYGSLAEDTERERLAYERESEGPWPKLIGPRLEKR